MSVFTFLLLLQACSREGGIDQFPNREPDPGAEVFTGLAKIAWHFNGKDDLFYHAYVASDKAASKLRIAETGKEHNHWPKLKSL